VSAKALSAPNIEAMNAHRKHKTPNHAHLRPTLNHTWKLALTPAAPSVVSSSFSRLGDVQSACHADTPFSLGFCATAGECFASSPHEAPKLRASAGRLKRSTLKRSTQVEQERTRTGGYWAALADVVAVHR
jgi:hypothetical protein